jgi:hypothetical protein
MYDELVLGENTRALLIDNDDYDNVSFNGYNFSMFGFFPAGELEVYEGPTGQVIQNNDELIRVREILRKND